MGRTILLIGLGGTGCSVIRRLTQKLRERTKDTVLSFAVDTDEKALSAFTDIKTIPMTDEDNLGTVVERLGAEQLAAWFPCDWDRDHTGFLKTLDMANGSNQWRTKSLLSFVNFLHNDNARTYFQEILAGIPEEDCVDIYVSASLAGGTGSGLFIPFTFYVKQFLTNQGKNVRRSMAMLACQDIYEEFLSAEQRVKTSANAYAALRELHAIGLVAGDMRDSETRMRKPYANIRIGDKTDVHFGCLFDSRREGGAAPDPAPFDRVFLMDKIPGVMSVTMHSDVMADALLPICDGTFNFIETPVDEKLKAIDAVYGGLSSLEIHYPEHSIVNYIAKQSVLDVMREQILFLPNMVEQRLQSQFREARSSGMYFANNVDQYAAAVLACADACMADGGAEQSLLARNGEGVEPETDAFDIRNSDGIARSACIFEERFACEYRDRLNRLIETCFKVSEPEKKSFSEAREEKKTEKKFLANTAQEAVDLLRAYYKHGVETLIAQRDSREESLRGIDGEGVFSVYLKELLSENGRPLNPVFGLIRLCQLFVYLSQTCEPYKIPFSKEDIAKEDVNIFPEDFQFLTQYEQDRSRYGKADGNRLFDLAKGDVSLVSGVSSERVLLGKDIESVTMRIVGRFAGQLCLELLDATRDAILAFRSIFVGLIDLVEDYASDVRTAKNAGVSENNLVFNVAGSIVDKQDRYKEYMEKTADPAESDAFLGELFRRTVSETAQGSQAKTILGEFEADCLRRVETFVTNGEKKTVLQRLLESDAKPFEKTPTAEGAAAFRRALRFAPSPLHLRSAEPTKTQIGIRIESRLLVSPATAQYVFDQRAAWDLPSEDPAAAVQHLLFLLGEYEVSVQICNNLTDDKMYVVRYVTDLPLHVIRSVDELNRDGTCYKNYRKALGMMAEQKTQMWNPHLCRELEKYGSLPYINPLMQQKGENMVAKAVLYALISAELFLISAETSEENIYYIAEGGLMHPITLDEQPIAAEDFLQLFAWVRQNEAFLEKWSAAYDKWVDVQKKKLPALGFGTVSRAELKYAITVTPLVRALCHNVFGQKNAPAGVPQYNLVELAYRVSRAEGEDSADGDGARILAVGYRTLYELCEYRCDDEDKETFAAIYESQRSTFVETLLSDERSAKQKGQTVLDWAMAQGAFVPYELGREPIDVDPASAQEDVH